MDERKGQERVNGAEPRVGVYICYCGGNISDVVAVEAVVAQAAGLPNVAVARANMFMCSDPGQQLIADDIENLGIDRVVIAACAPSLHETTFRGLLERVGLNPYLYEHVNIREQVSWSHDDCGEATTKSVALVAAAVAKARMLRSLEPVWIPAERAVVVVGGGVAGLRAATDLARAGLSVTLVEKEFTLGGRVGLLDSVFPNDERAEDILCRLCDEALANPRITIRTGSTVQSVEGYVGMFKLKLRERAGAAVVDAVPDGETRDTSSLGWRCQPFRGFGPADAFEDNDAGPEGTKGRAKTRSVTAGAIVVATGFDLYVPPEGEYGFGQLPEVITLVDFIQWLSEQAEGETPVFRGKPVRGVGFIHCVGSRQVEGVHKPGEDGRINEHCSRVCCTATLHAICDLRARFPEVTAYDFYQDIRAYGRGHEEYYEGASKSGVVFLRYDGASPPQVAESDAGETPITVSCVDGLTWGEEVEVGVDLVVLAVGMNPAPVGNLATSLKLPVSADGFLQEVHPKLRPVEQCVNGVFIAGACQAPKDTTEACASASAAAGKACGLLAGGNVELDPFVAHVDALHCIGDGACFDECPCPGALTMEEYDDGNKKAVVNAAICTGCGACVAVCPTRAIDLSGWSLDAYEAMVDALLASHMETLES